ncbi:MAG: hypothetical protein BZY79_04875 [SAR202 cluster bacterium Casp-Chloro-G4]|nr:GNAT family N-acetyltransferase [Chloroflexota bacterium]MDA1226404.1 GNAT family N-acetyltransferase [Chloroflexota bacterium]PKB61216.1 MAG: hypothetical protein BZY79_04875 [SAR202 cluster bacterium Casp-Chloro-G4]
MDVNIVLQRYPFDVKLEDGSEFTIRPLAKEDKIRLARFFQTVSEEDRFYLKENVTAPEIIHGWIDNMNYERAVPILAIVDGNIVADATLHRSRTPARMHVGELRVVVHPNYRGVGLGARLIQELIDLGRALELEILFFELVDRREMGAIHAAATAGFEEVAVLRNRVKDVYGSLQDLVIMERSLESEMAYGHF